MTEVLPSPPSPVVRFRRRFFANSLVKVSFAVVCVFLIAAVLAPFLPLDPYSSNFGARLLPPSAAHWFGTDQLGRDMLTRMVVGSSIALMVAFVSVTIGAVAGGMLGLIAGYTAGSRLDAIIMRCMDILLTFPWLLLIIAVIAILGPSIPNVMIAIGITLIPEYARLVRATALGIRNQDFVLAATALGATRRREIFIHILPHCVPHFIVFSTIKIGRSILAEASVSYLGLGVQPPHPSWGYMIANGQEYLLTAPHLSLVPGVVMMIVVMALNVMGDGLRDALDPKSSEAM